MDGIHDLGGVEGFGDIAIEEDEPVFHHDWEARVMAMRLLMGFWRKWNLDAGRHSVELLPPADYLSFTYYEKWLASLVNMSVGAGLISSEEVASGHAAPGQIKRRRRRTRRPSCNSFRKAAPARAKSARPRLSPSEIGCGLPSTCIRAIPGCPVTPAPAPEKSSFTMVPISSRM